MDYEIAERIRRLYVSIGTNCETDLKKFPVKIHKTEKGICHWQDFNGGATESELSETLHGWIANVASFPDHIRHWTRGNAISDDKVYAYFKASPDFCVIRDLWNNDKHGYPPLDSGWSGIAPLITEVHGTCQVTGGVGVSGIQMGRSGLRSFGGANARVVITAELIDKDGSSINDVYPRLVEATKVCEQAVAHFGIVKLSEAATS